MSSGTGILNKMILFQHQACWVTESEHTCPHPWLLKIGCLVVAQHHQMLNFLRHIFCTVTGAAAWVNLADFWLIVHTGVSTYSLQGFSEDSDWNIFSLFVDIPGLSHQWRILHSVLSHHISRHRYLGFDGLSLAPLRSTKFNPNHPKSCVKKILITVTIFLKRTSPKPKITMYSHANRSFSEKKKMKRHVKK